MDKCGVENVKWCRKCETITKKIIKSWIEDETWIQQGPIVKTKLPKLPNVQKM